VAIEKKWRISPMKLNAYQIGDNGIDKSHQSSKVKPKMANHQ